MSSMDSVDEEARRAGGGGNTLGMSSIASGWFTRSSPPSRAVPEAVRRLYRVDGTTYRFPDGTVAFADRGRSLVTPSENTEVVKSMVEIAQARGWTRLAVSGSEQFRQRAWAAGEERGLVIAGYQPSKEERERRRRRMAARADPSTAAIVPEPQPQSAVPTADARPGERSTAAEEPELVSGTLVEHGVARYEFLPDRDESYYVQLNQGGRLRMLWGKDLKRTLAESATRPQIGDRVGARTIGRVPVTIKIHETDERTGEIVEREKTAYRNRWVVERSPHWETLSASARMLRDEKSHPVDAARVHPPLKNAYFYVQHAQLLAQSFTDPTARATFLAAVREGLAKTLESGAPLPPARLRSKTQEPSLQEDARTTRVPDRAGPEAIPQR